MPSKSEIEYINMVSDINGTPHYSEELALKNREKYEQSKTVIENSVSPAKKKADWLKEDLRPGISINSDGNVI